MDHRTARRHDQPDRGGSRFIANLGELGRFAIEIDRHGAHRIKIRSGHLPVRTESALRGESLKLAHRVEQLDRCNLTHD
jgi:hypothetical protein